MASGIEEAEKRWWITPVTIIDQRALEWIQSEIGSEIRKSTSVS